jgi:hypothetical protein
MPPEILASLPITTVQGVFDLFCILSQVAYAEVKTTISSGLSPSPGLPPMVPLMPEMEVINDTVLTIILK